ncbi:MAG: radical SAM protein [Vicinamibacterales bacterium]|nr:radical SAM protein [Vicinamibacterales bacterium]
MHILLVCPSADYAVWDRVKEKSAGVTRKAFTVPLHLATVAALTPDEDQVRIWDEAVHGPIDEDTDVGGGYDLVGLTGYPSHLPRARDLGALFRARGLPVVIGGAGVTSEPETCRDHFDVLILGEAERVWPQFLRDFKAGRHAREYKADVYPDLSESPAPRWDSIADTLASGYVTGGIQVNRGCPYACEFCNVWLDFGRKIRTKPVDQCLDELATMERLGIRRVLVCTDNFIGHPKYAKELLRAMIAQNETFVRPLQYYTELTFNVSRDPELLALLADATFVGLFIGIESVNEESLKETRKRHNIHRGLVEQSRTVQSYGLPIHGSFILGFDHDTPDAFRHTFAFMQEACIIYPHINLLKALRNTDLWTRLHAEQRIIDRDLTFPDLSKADPVRDALSNIVPGKMTRVEMFEGYRWLVEQVWDWRNVEARILGFLAMIERMPPRTVDEVVRHSIAFKRAAFPRFPGVDMPVVERILAHTEARFPDMLDTICTLLLFACEEAARLPALIEALTVHIERERRLAAAPSRLARVG